MTCDKLRLAFLLSSVVDRILQNADVFCSAIQLSYQYDQSGPPTVPQEDLALGIWAPRLGTWVSFSKFVAGFDINLSTLGNGTEVCIPGIVETEDGVPRSGRWGSCCVP